MTHKKKLNNIELLQVISNEYCNNKINTIKITAPLFAKTCNISQSSFCVACVPAVC